MRHRTHAPDPAQVAPLPRAHPPPVPALAPPTPPAPPAPPPEPEVKLRWSCCCPRRRRRKRTYAIQSVVGDVATKYLTA